MALHKNYTTTGDVTINGDGWSVSDGKRQVAIGPCYVKVQSISGNKTKLSIDVSVSSDSGSLKRFSTKPEFAGAEDC